MIWLAISIASLPLLPRDEANLTLEALPVAEVEAPPATVAHPGMGNNSIDWSGLIIAHFPESQVATALRIVACESGGNPQARNPSGATGLFQIMPFWADHYGVARADLFDPSVNAMVAALIVRDEGWDEWTCY